MKSKTKKLKLISSKVKKYNHKKGEYYFEEDRDQDKRLNVKDKVTYIIQEGKNIPHSLEGPSLGGKYYINGIQYNKFDWTEYKRSLKEIGNPLILTA